MTRFEKFDRLLELHLEENESGRYAHSKEYDDCYSATYNLISDVDDIEKDLKVDPIIVFKALKNGFYYRDGKKIIHATPLLSCYEITFDWNDGYPILQYWELVEKSLTLTNTLLGDVFVGEHGKTWALTREELEKKEKSEND